MKQRITVALLVLFTFILPASFINAQNLTQVPKVTSVPDSLYLDKFYKKYLDANGIAITSSWRVPDSAMVQAWKIVDFMTRDLPKPVLNAMVKTKTRVTVMARYEGTTDVPEHAHLAADTTLNWDVRARG